MDKKSKRLEVFTLGAFLVRRGEENLSHKYRFSKKPWRLLKYLVSNRDRVVNKDTIADIIGLEDYYSDPDKLIHNLVYRLRQMLGEDPAGSNLESAVVFENGGYKWNGNDANWLDADEFDTLCRKAKADCYTKPKEAMLVFERALALYKDDFLCEDRLDEFTYSARSYYHNLYLKMVHSQITHLSLTRAYDEIIETCKNALRIDYFDLELHVEYIKALLEKGDTRQALSHYEEATEKLYTQEGMTLPGEMTAIYKSIKQGKRNTQYSLSGIQDELQEKIRDKGALLCDIDAFNFIHNLEKKRVKRFNQISCIVLLSVIQSDSPTKSDESFKEEMDKILKIVLESLRGTDVVTKWSDTQFLLILSGMPVESIEIVFKRIITAYYNAGSSSDIKIVKSINQI